MSKKLNRVLDEIQKTEEKIAVWQEHLRELNTLREQLENQEIIKSIRSMKLDSRRMLELLEGIQSGTVSIRCAEEENYNTVDRAGTGNDMKDTSGQIQMQEERASESEDRSNEET